MTRDITPDSHLYEISVAGTLGPVVRHALRPCHTGETSYLTVLRLSVSDDQGVAEMVGKLESMGLELAAVEIVP